MSLICGRTDRIDGGDIYHNEDIIEISIVARVVDGIQAVRRLIVDSITTRTGEESETSPPSSGEKRVISSHAERKKKATERVSAPTSLYTCRRGSSTTREENYIHVNCLVIISTVGNYSRGNELAHKLEADCCGGKNQTRLKGRKVVQ